MLLLVSGQALRLQEVKYGLSLKADGNWSLLRHQMLLTPGPRIVGRKLQLSLLGGSGFLPTGEKMDGSPHTGARLFTLMLRLNGFRGIGIARNNGFPAIGKG